MFQSNIILQAMKQLDMDEIEAEVYIAFLNDKKPNLTNLAKSLTVHRTVIYKAIDKLKSFNLMVETDGKITIEPPERLISILRQKEAENRLAIKQVDSYLSELNAKYYSNYEKPDYKIYSGQFQFIDLHNQILNEITTDYHFFGNIEMFHDIFDIQYQEYWTKKRIGKGIKSKRLIFDSSRHNQLVAKTKTPESEFRVLPEKFRNMGSFSLYNKKVLCWDPALPRVIKLENEVMFTTFSQIFDLLWEFCE